MKHPNTIMETVVCISAITVQMGIPPYKTPVTILKNKRKSPRTTPAQQCRGRSAKLRPLSPTEGQHDAAGGTTGSRPEAAQSLRGTAYSKQEGNTTPPEGQPQQTRGHPARQRDNTAPPEGRHQQERGHPATEGDNKQRDRGTTPRRQRDSTSTRGVVQHPARTTPRRQGDNIRYHYSKYLQSTVQEITVQASKCKKSMFIDFQVDLRTEI